MRFHLITTGGTHCAFTFLCATDTLGDLLKRGNDDQNREDQHDDDCRQQIDRDTQFMHLCTQRIVFGIMHVVRLHSHHCTLFHSMYTIAAASTMSAAMIHPNTSISIVPFCTLLPVEFDTVAANIGAVHERISARIVQRHP